MGAASGMRSSQGSRGSRETRQPKRTPRHLLAGMCALLVCTSLLGSGGCSFRTAVERKGAKETTEATWKTTDAGNLCSLATKSDGSLWAWGDNMDGKLGIGAGGDLLSALVFLGHKNTPVRVGDDTDWKTVSAGWFHCLALKEDGSLWAWGNNWRGQLGDGTDANRSAPTRIGTDTDWKTVSAGANHSLAIKSDGSLWAWGNGLWGQLGDGGNWNRVTPVRIGADADWKTVSAGGDHSLALKEDGSLWAWGSNWHGQFGDGTDQNSKNVPVHVGDETDWKAVSAGGSSVNIENWHSLEGEGHSLALKEDGSLWAWGGNADGQLGLGDFSRGKNTPRRIGNETDWKAIDAGSSHSLALKSDGSLWAWGNNYFGQLGDGTGESWWESVRRDPSALVALMSGRKDAVDNVGNTMRKDNKSIPVRIGDAADWEAISAGRDHSLAVRSDGSLWAWGSNMSGELGNGTGGGWLGIMSLSSNSTPTRVGGATD